MLKQLSIRNFTLIDSLDIKFNPGFSVITGETGAGKSIILGAIGLLLGQRADSKAIKNGAAKCTVEAHFDLSKYKRELFSMYSGESREISLIFPQELLNVALERFGETIKPIRYGSGEYLFTASIQVSNPFFGWIASFGGRVRIHSPEEVKGQYKEFIKELRTF